MESREMSESKEILEKEVTLGNEAAEAAAECVENKPEVVAAETALAVDESNATAEESASAGYSSMSKSELVEALEKLLDKPIESVKEDVPQIKAAFFDIRKEEVAKEKAAFLAAGNEEAAFAVKDDAEENRVKEILQSLKEKRAAYNAEQDAIKAENLEKKRKIIDEITAISNDADNINKQFAHVQQLQQDFKAIGDVPATNETDLWKEYQVAVERFYDLLKMNKELRDLACKLCQFCKSSLSHSVFRHF